MRSARGSPSPARAPTPAWASLPVDHETETQRAPPDLLNGTLWGQSALAPQEKVISQLLPGCHASPALGLPAWGGFSPSLTSLPCWATAPTTSSPPLSLGTLPPKLAGELQGFLSSGGKFHLTLSSGTRTGIRFVDDGVLLSGFSKRGTMKRLQLLSKNPAPIAEFICIYKWHSSEGSPHPWRCTPPSIEHSLIFPSALPALHTLGKMWCLTVLPDLAMIELLLAGKNYMKVFYLSVSLDAGQDSKLEHQIPQAVIKF